MTKISPIAEYLTKNHAITKREGNVWHFYNKYGLYIGKQVKIDQGSSTLYAREVYADGFKKLYYECKVLEQKCVYFKDNKMPIGLGILPTETYLMTHVIDFITNKVTNIQKLKKIINPMKLIAIDDYTNVGLFKINKPFKFKEETLANQTLDLRRRFMVNHTLN